MLITMEPKKLENNLFFRLFTYLNSITHSVFQNTSSTIQMTADTYLNLISTKKTNKKLLQENQQLKAHLTLMEEIQSENSRLKEIMNFKQNEKLNLLIAQVISRDPISKYQLISINKGEKQGVKKNMIAINEKGFVGYVFRSYPDFSQIILLTDPHASIPVTVTRSRVHGVLEGADHSTCRLKFLKRRDDVRPGDTIVTAHLNTTSGKGFPVGTVSKVSKEEYGLTQEVTVIPFINPSQLEEVMVVK